MTIWKPIKDAPKTSERCQFKGPEILGIDAFGRVKVISWTTEYPSDGEWMFAYIPSDYIDGIQRFNAVGWLPLSVLPELPEHMKYKKVAK